MTPSDTNILPCEPIHQRGLRILEARGRVVRPASLAEDALLALIPPIDAILLRALGRITRRLLEAAPRLKVIGRHGIGLDNVDVEAATARGVWVVNTPDAPTQPVAEHFLMPALMLSKGFPRGNRLLRRGEWRVRFDEPGCVVRKFMKSNAYREAFIRVCQSQRPRKALRQLQTAAKQLFVSAKSVYLKERKKAAAKFKAAGKPFKVLTPDAFFRRQDAKAMVMKEARSQNRRQKITSAL